MNNSIKYFDPETLAGIRPLGLRARTLVEGLVAGHHRSPLHGHSIEFAQHRDYVPGDDLRQVDWKVYARSDRYYLKQYEDETNLNCYFLLDQSESMTYQGQNSPLSKMEYAQLIACSLAYLVISQQDCAGLVTFSESVDDWLIPSGAAGQLDDMIRLMEKVSGSKRTSLARVLEEVVSRIARPSIIVLLSDLLDEVDSLIHALKILRSAGHDLILVHVLDPDEVDFPFEQRSRFEGLEGVGTLTTDPLLIAGAYRKAMATFRQTLRLGCEQLNADYFSFRSDESLAHSLPAMLSTRLARRS